MTFLSKIPPKNIVYEIIKISLNEVANIANKGLHGEDQNKFSQKNCLQWG